MQVDIQGMPNTSSECKQITSYTNLFQQTQFETTQQRGEGASNGTVLLEINPSKVLTLHFSYLWWFGKNLKGLGEQQEAPLQHPPFPSGYHIPAWSDPAFGRVDKPRWPWNHLLPFPLLPGIQIHSVPCSRNSCWNSFFLSWLQNNPSQCWWSPVLGQVCSEFGHLLGLPCSLYKSPG